MNGIDAAATIFQILLGAAACAGLIAVAICLIAWTVRGAAMAVAEAYRMHTELLTVRMMLEEIMQDGAGRTDKTSSTGVE